MPRLLMFAATAAAQAGCPTAAAAGGRVDPDLAAAEAFVARSDRYLHQSKLTRGMKGYGLTILAGTKVEKFDATVISVMRDWYPHQDVVLCRLGGLGLCGRKLCCTTCVTQFEPISSQMVKSQHLSLSPTKISGAVSPEPSEWDSYFPSVFESVQVPSISMK